LTNLFYWIKQPREFYQINEQLTEEQVIERVANNYYQVYVRRQNLNVLDSTYINTNKNIIKGRQWFIKKIDLDRIIVKLSNIKNTTPTSIEWRSNSRKCLEVLYGNAY
jgi:hypothetical protein